MFLLDFIKSLVPHISKNDVLEDIRITKGELTGLVIPATMQGEEHFRVIKMASKTNKELSSLFYRGYNLAKSSSQLNFVAEIAKVMPTVLKNLEFVETEIDAAINTDVITAGITAKKALLLRTAEEASFISRFTLDILTVLYANEAVNAEVEVEESLQVSDIIIARVDKGMLLYARILSILGDKDFILAKKYNSIPDVVINDSTYETIIATYKESNLDPINTIGLKGFESNPIYHVRLMIAEWQANRYKSMKDKKRMLELRLLQLKLQSEKKTDVKLEKEISYIQSRIEGIEYNMSKMED